MKLFMPFILAITPLEAKKGNRPTYEFYKAPKGKIIGLGTTFEGFSGEDTHGNEIGKKHPLRVLQSTSKTFCKLVYKELENKNQAARYCQRWTATITRYADTFSRDRNFDKK